ncbi:sigma-70 family RNA polymerase sigma factor [Marinactinospora thermotolerans]|uniref:RNA polymerase sigma factor n=1 Tax=Marinactinospora thermotolerans DSM 45154 TaxID=1122192 RepID=A0A1T4N639_9ACTN|nr:sigma-70 family RNA polymerase sigma factor [Marinactinospora thermotolerans]SJZ74507.1 RNA polymerase sigma-70 factor, ECF subfamily [Marinactinospora thermotolerans DSM 45154]
MHNAEKGPCPDSSDRSAERRAVDVRPSTDDEYFRFRELFDAHYDALLKFVVRVNGGNRHAAEDIAQETLLKAWRGLDGLRGDAQEIRPWLYTVARRLVIDADRSRRARPQEVADAPLEEIPTRDPTTSLVQTMAVHQALATLSMQHRTVIEYVYLRDYATETTARILGIPVGTVKSRLHYGLRMLRRTLGIGSAGS